MHVGKLFHNIAGETIFGKAIPQSIMKDISY